VGMTPTILMVEDDAAQRELAPTSRTV